MKGKTNLSIEQVIQIARQYVDSQKEEYEINSQRILFDEEFDVESESVWYIDIISLINKKRWPNDYETLIISDKEGVVKYVMNEHGRLMSK